MTAIIRPRSLVPLGRLNLTAHSRAELWDEAIDWSAPIDHARPFICPALTPLFYTRFYAAMSAMRVPRYIQWAGPSYLERIAFSKESLAGGALASLAQRSTAPAEFRRVQLCYQPGIYHVPESLEIAA